MQTRTHPLLIAFAVLVFFFLLGPLVIIIGSALSETSYLTFPPQGLTLHWFENIFEISAFRRTMMTSFMLAVGGTALSMPCRTLSLHVLGLRKRLLHVRCNGEEDVQGLHRLLPHAAALQRRHGVRQG